MIFPNHHYEKTRNMVALLGIFRSGTTMLGNLLASFKGAEYSFEPALLFYYESLALGGNIPTDMAGVLRTYFAEDILLNHVHGRGYNMRPGDDTCVLNYKSYADVMSRWNSISNSLDAMKYYQEHPELRVIFKVPSIFKIMPAVLDAFPSMQFVEVRRNLTPVVSSVLVKHWFADETLRNSGFMASWPCSAIVDGVQVPYFVPERDHAFWASSNEMSRAVYACVQSAEASLVLKKALKDSGRLDCILDVPYERILMEPQSTMKRIASFLSMQFGDQTESLIRKINPSRAKVKDPGIAEQCDRTLYEKFLEINSLYTETKHMNWDI